MEFVALSSTVLDALAKQDPQLGRVYGGVYASDTVPPPRGKRVCYIVNTDPKGEPGQHWLGVWCEDNCCDIMDSYGLPLTHYQAPGFHEWLSRYFTKIRRNAQTLQAVNSAACGDYALLYLKARVRGHSLEHFVSQFSTTNLVENDHVVGSIIQTLLENGPETYASHCNDQSCQIKYH